MNPTMNKDMETMATMNMTPTTNASVLIAN